MELSLTRDASTTSGPIYCRTVVTREPRQSISHNSFSITASQKSFVTACKTQHLWNGKTALNSLDFFVA